MLCLRFSLAHLLQYMLFLCVTYWQLCTKYTFRLNIVFGAKISIFSETWFMTFLCP